MLRRVQSVPQGLGSPSGAVVRYGDGFSLETRGVRSDWETPRSRRGKYYLLTYLDHFTKFAEAVPIPNKEAETVCRVLAEELFPRFGAPLQLLTNQGREFENRLVRGLSTIYGVDKIRTSPYRPSTNGAIERLHRTLNAMFGRVVDDSQRDWNVRVSAVMAAYRATIHGATGYSPNYMMFGRNSVSQLT